MKQNHLDKVKINKDKSITTEIKIAFKIVPIPGFCLRGNQNSNTTTLTMNVVIPIVRSVLKAKPDEERTMDSHQYLQLLIMPHQYQIKMSKIKKNCYFLVLN